VVTEQEWISIREDFDEVGYCCFTLEPLIAKPAKELERPKIEEKTMPEGTIQFETGTLTKERLRLLRKLLSKKRDYRPREVYRIAPNCLVVAISLSLAAIKLRE